MIERTRSHILGSFDAALEALRSDAIMMGSLAERALSNAFRGLLERNEELCNMAIADDEEIDQLEIQVDREGIGILLKFQPVASDLRQVISTMKVSGNLERIGDQAVSIARRARRLARHPELPDVAFLEPMYAHATAMLRDCVKAFVRRDAELARSLEARDKTLDELNAEAGARLTECMARNPGRIEDYLGLVFIARHLERVGDHAENVGEDAVYAVAAEDIRHRKNGPPHSREV